MLTNSRKNRWSCLVGKYIVFAVTGTCVDSYIGAVDRIITDKAAV